MARVKHAVASLKRRKRVFKKAKGQFGGRGNLLRTAKESVAKGMSYAYRDRKKKKILYRQLWITRIKASCLDLDITYSRFMNGLKKANCLINRKVLAELAVNHKAVFTKLVDVAKKA